MQVSTELIDTKMSEETIESYFLELPSCILNVIFSFLDVGDLFHIVQVCQRFFQQVKRNYWLWKRVCFQHWQNKKFPGWKQEDNYPVLPEDCEWKWLARALAREVGNEENKSVLGNTVQEALLFIGELTSGQLEGKGLRFSLVGDFYHYGSWIENKLQGTGGQVYYDGPNSYKGDWKNGLFHGKGLKKWDDGEFYEGSWEEGIMKGEGMYVWKTGEEYRGEWDMGKMNGKGAKKWMDGDKYEGMWSDGKHHGHGIYTWKTGAIFAGNWEQGNIHGNGEMTWEDGTRYKGNWTNGNPNGNGIKYFANGNQYDGEWIGGAMWGQGTFTYKCGDQYRGSWKDNEENGFGEYQTCFGTVYSGQFVDGQRQGFGTFTHIDGHSWSGDWVKSIPVDPKACAHPKLKECLDEGKCTRYLTSNVAGYGQVLEKCATCDSSEEKAPYLCATCVTKCHNGHSFVFVNHNNNHNNHNNHNHHNNNANNNANNNNGAATSSFSSKKIWTVGRTFCQCTVCTPAPASSQPIIPPSS